MLAVKTSFSRGLWRGRGQYHHLTKLAIEQAVLLSTWRAEDRALLSSRERPVVCSDCGARNLEHFYTSKAGGYALCPRCFQRRVERGVAREADTHQP